MKKVRFDSDNDNNQVTIEGTGGPDGYLSYIRSEHLDTLSILRNKFLGIFLIAGGKATSVDLIDSILTIKQRGGLLQTEALRFNDEHVTEDQLEGEPTTVNNL